jgi:hypothetical protein
MSFKFTEEETSTQFIKFLPRAMAMALQAYEHALEMAAMPPGVFVEGDQDTTNMSVVKEIKARQDACKTAVGHIEALTKLAVLIKAQNPVDSNSQQAVFDLVKAAMANIESGAAAEKAYKARARQKRAAVEQERAEDDMKTDLDA